ncbi:MAG: energy-coupling factor ABC transporter ATP-binding protein [Desulfurispora sp.]|uniref:energy-coupling factor ABC transporter ATP-binding protein n=1 Tax=Desulfurispora sp. TaxID=3014275 RepID=UPI004049B8DD
MNPLLKVEKLSFSYPGASAPALRSIDLQVEEGELVGIAGPCGAGKSTLLQCLAGIIPRHRSGIYSGTVRVADQGVAGLDRRTAARTVGIVLQDPEAQLVAPVVEEEIAFGLENLGLPAAQVDRRITEALQATGIDHLRHCATSRLSGGQKQRVIIAAVLAMRPRLLLLDEPTAELDPRGSRMVWETLHHLVTAHNMTVLVVEQKIGLLAEYCSRLVLMEQGRIILDGRTRTVLAQQESINRAGCDCPPVSELARLLQEKGLYRGDLPVTVEEAYSMVQQIIKVITENFPPGLTARVAAGGGRP